MMTIEEYAIGLVALGAEFCAETDANDSGDIAEKDHDAALDLTLEMARAIRAYPSACLEALLALVERHRTEAAGR